MNEHEALVLDTAEKDLGEEVSLIEDQAQRIVVSNDTEYQKAGDFIKSLKQKQKQVTEFFEPLRVAAKESYDSILARKKEMLDPLISAEKILKNAMVSFMMEQERKRKEQEEAMRKLAQAETERKLNEAVAAESAGDKEAADAAMMEAEVMQGVAIDGVIPGQTPKAKGVSTSKTYVIKSIDSQKVPVEICGAVIRPVDEKAVLALIKATKGQIQIPGVEFEESVVISVRS